MGVSSSTVAPLSNVRSAFSLNPKQDVTRLMMPVYYCQEPCSEDDLKLANDSWDMITSDASPNFALLKGQPGYNYGSCVQMFYGSFYSRLFDVHPISRQMFTINGLVGQGSFLVGMISICLTDISHKEHGNEFKMRLVRLAEVHNDRGVKAVEYGIVGEVLFWAIRRCLGDKAFTTACQFAWIKIFSRMLAIMVPVAVEYELKSKSLAQVDRMLMESSSCSRSDASKRVNPEGSVTTAESSLKDSLDNETVKNLIS